MLTKGIEVGAFGHSNFFAPRFCLYPPTSQHRHAYHVVFQEEGCLPKGISTLSMLVGYHLFLTESMPTEFYVGVRVGTLLQSIMEADRKCLEGFPFGPAPRIVGNKDKAKVRELAIRGARSHKGLPDSFWASVAL